MKKRLIQAYKQAPWRVQLQWLGMFLVCVVIVSAIIGVYLSINSQAAAAGREVQSLEIQIGEMNDEIAELTAELASTKATEKYKARAESLGFKLLNPAEAVYMEIPGFDPNHELVLAPPRTNLITNTPIVQSAYRSSLWDWFVENIWLVSGSSTGTQGEVLP